MDNHAKFFLSEAKERISETEAQLYLIQHWNDDSDDLVLREGLKVLEDCIAKTYKSISLALGEQNENTE